MPACRKPVGLVLLLLAAPACTAAGPAAGSVNLLATPAPGTISIPQPAAPIAPSRPSPVPPRQSLPQPGTPVFGPHGTVGIVTNRTGSFATVAPVGRGAPGLMMPNGNGTATVYQPNGPPIVVPNPPR